MKMTMTKHESPIKQFELRYDLHPGLSDARYAGDWTKTFPATRAHLAFALDQRDYERIRLRGSYGSASAHVMAILNGGERIIEDDDPDAISEARAESLSTCNGEIDADDVHALRTSVWNGQNHIEFYPRRSMTFLSDEDSYEQIGHALIRWTADGGVEDIRIDEGWDIADEYWGTLGNVPWGFGTDGRCALDLQDREKLLAEASIEYDTVEFGPGDVMILVQASDQERAREIFDRAVQGIQTR